MSETKSSSGSGSREPELRVVAANATHRYAMETEKHPSDEELAKYLAGDLDSDQVGDLRVHLSRCVDCLVVTELLGEPDEPGQNGGGQDPTGHGDGPPCRDRAHLDQVNRLHAEIVRRQRDGPAVRESGESSIPSDPLIELVGRLALSASDSLRAVCRAQLWPRVRAAVGVESPGTLASGTYDNWLTTTKRFVESPTALDVVARASTPLDVCAMRPAEIISFPVRPVPASPPIDARGSSDAWLQTTILTRLNATWYLSGIDELWPSEGVSAARQLWHEGGLARADAYLLGCLDLLMPAMAGVAQSVVDLAAVLDSPWCGVLRTIMPVEVTATAAEALVALRFEDAVVEAAVSLRTVLAEHWGEEADTMAIRPLPTQSGQLLEVESPVGGLSAIWFAPPDAGALMLDYRGHTAFDTVVRASTLTISDESDEEAEDDQGVAAVVAVSRFVGVADPYALVFGPDAVSIPASAFIGSHAAACEALRQSLVEGVAAHADWISADGRTAYAVETASRAIEAKPPVPPEPESPPRIFDLVIQKLTGFAAAYIPDFRLGVPQFALAGDGQAAQFDVLTEDLTTGGPLTVTITREIGTDALIVGVRSDGAALAGAVVTLNKVDALGLTWACAQATTDAEGTADLGTAAAFAAPQHREHYRIEFQVDEK